MILKYSALTMLSDIIGAKVPELFGRICIAPAAKDHALAFPHLYIHATKWRFVVQDPDNINPLTGALREPEAGVTVYRVGDWTADVELRLGCTSAQERYSIGDKIEQLFFDGTGSCTALADAGKFLRPGIMLADIPGAAARVAYLLDDESWMDEKVFTQELYTNLNIQVELPLLVSRYAEGEATITDLRIGLTESLELLSTGDPLPQDAQTVRINANGTITAV